MGCTDAVGRLGAGDCRLALLPIQLADLTIPHDTTTWAGIVISGSLLYTQCVAITEREGELHIPSGGIVLTGKPHQLYQDSTTSNPPTLK